MTDWPLLCLQALQQLTAVRFMLAYLEWTVCSVLASGSLCTHKWLGNMQLQGRTYLCKKLDLGSKVAMVRSADLKYYTKTRDFTDVHVVGGHTAYPVRVGTFTSGLSLSCSAV